MCGWSLVLRPCTALAAATAFQGGSCCDRTPRRFAQAETMTRLKGSAGAGRAQPCVSKMIEAGGGEMTSVDEHTESIRARGEDRESHGCARHAPAGRFGGRGSPNHALPTPVMTGADLPTLSGQVSVGAAEQPPRRLRATPPKSGGEP